MTAIMEANRVAKEEEAWIRAEEERIRAIEEDARITAVGEKTRGMILGGSDNKSTSKLIRDIPIQNTSSNKESAPTSELLRPMQGKSSSGLSTSNDKGNEIKWIGSTGIEYDPDGKPVRTHARNLYYALQPIEGFSFLNYKWNKDVSKNTTSNYQFFEEETRQKTIEIFDKVKNSDIVKSFDGFGETVLKETGLDNAYGTLENALSISGQ